MYLIGLLVWTLVAGRVAWALAILLTRRVNARWLQAVVTLLLLPVVFMAPLADEIVGKYQFDRLCEEAKEVKIYGTIPVGEELYTPEGKWRLELPGANRDLGEKVDAYFRWEQGGNPPVVVQSVAMPIYQFNNKIFDRRSNRLLAEWTEYGTSGGWLSQGLETPIFVRSTCTPQLVDTGIYKHLVMFAKVEGENK